MPEVEVTVGGNYKESDDHLPDPTDQMGTVDTSGTAGTAHGRIEEVTKIFDVAKAQDLQTAARALDPKDTDVSESLVTLPAGPTIIQGDPKEAAERVKTAAKEATKSPIEIGGPTLAQRQAAEGDSPKGGSRATSKS